MKIISVKTAKCFRTIKKRTYLRTNLLTWWEQKDIGMLEGKPPAQSSLYVRSTCQYVSEGTENVGQSS